MKRWTKLLMIPTALFLLVACGNDDQETTHAEGEESVEVANAPSIHKGDTVKTTIDIENSDTWVEDAAEKTNAASGDDYVQLDRGVLTVNQINDMMKHLPLEVTFADDNSQFLYYNYRNEPKDMLAARAPEQVGDALVEGHPEEAQKNMQRALDLFYAGEETFFQRKAKSDNEDEFIVITYQAVYDEEGNYKGITQYAQDIQPTIDFYLEQNGMRLEEDPDAVSGATSEDKE